MQAGQDSHLHPSSFCDGAPTAPTAPHLPPGVLISVCTHLSWADTLSARAACRHWAWALSLLLTRLRVPLTSWVPGQQTAGSPLAAAYDVTVGAQADSGLAATASAQEPPVEQSSRVASQLSAALDRLGHISHVTLVLTPATSAADLSRSLEVVGAREYIKCVTIWELTKGNAALDKTWPRPRVYVNSLNLHHLQSVEVLRLSVESWLLTDIWRQVGRLHGSTPPGSPHLNSSDSRSGSSDDSTGHHHQPCCSLHTLMIDQCCPYTCDLHDQQLPSQLQHLTTPLPGQRGVDGAVVCPLPVAHQQYLEALAAGLPQLQTLTVTDPYEGLVDVLGGFQHLHVLRCQIGCRFTAAAFDIHADPDGADSPCVRILSQLPHLRRLECCRQQVEPEGFYAAKRAGPGAMRQWWDERFKLHWLQGNRQLQHLAVPLVVSGQAIDSPLHQLQSLEGYHESLTVELLQQVVQVGPGLTSLSLHPGGVQLSPRSTGRLPPLSTIPVSRALSTLTNLQSLTLVSKTLYITLQDAPSVWQQLPLLHSLTLQHIILSVDAAGHVMPSAARPVFEPGPHMFGSLEDSHSTQRSDSRCVLWLSDLPCRQLRHLALGRYSVLLLEDGLTDATAPDAAATDSSECLSGCLDPQQQQQQHQPRQHAAQVQAAVAPDDVITRQLGELSCQPQASAADGAPGGTAAAPRLGQSEIKAAEDLSGLVSLQLVDCSCLCVPAQITASTRSEQPAATAAAVPPAATAEGAPIRCLLARTLAVVPRSSSSNSSSSGNSSSSSSLGESVSKLRQLELQHIEMEVGDVHFIVHSPLSTSLQQLRVQASSWVAATEANSSCGTADLVSASTTAAVSPRGFREPQLPAPLPELLPGVSLADTLGAAAAAGKLRELRQLWLSLSRQPGQAVTASLTAGVSFGPSLVAACCSLPHLQDLLLAFDPLEQAAAGSLGDRWCQCDLPEHLKPAGHAFCQHAPVSLEPCQKLTQLRHLQRLRLLLLSQETACLRIRRTSIRGVVVGRCSRCGCPMRDSQLQDPVLAGLLHALPGCECWIDSACK